MRKVSWKLMAAVTSAAVMLVGWSASAQPPVSFTVSVKGTITQQNGTKIKIGDVSGEKGCSELVSTCSNLLVATYFQGDNYVEVDEVAPGATNVVVKVIWSSYRLGQTAAGKLNADLETSDSDTVSLPNEIPSFNGDLQVDGKVNTSGKTSFSGKLIGVWNDSINGDTNAPNAVFKGTIKSTGTITTPVFD